LFHEASLNIYNEKPLFFKCRCSREKVEQVIQSFKEEELNDLKEDGKILIDCEFCGIVYEYREDKEIEIVKNTLQQ
ncbi:MAG: Hsp33 family molecular chaperone HslO, partial [Proteobacteria bacterium]|nr:Hsp33 family molecular chaperone HslO [Pseudomonadota bacterium]